MAEWDGRNIPDGTLARGRRAVIDHAAHWASIWADWTIEVEQLKEVGADTVIAYTRERERGETGCRYTTRRCRFGSIGTPRELSKLRG